MSARLWFFGCRDQAGHYLTAPNGQGVRDFEADNLNIPRAAELDGSVIFLPFPEIIGRGALTYLPANDRTVLAWWGSPWDSRGKVNNALIGAGYMTADALWQHAAQQMPSLMARLAMPTIMRAGRPV